MCTEVFDETSNPSQDGKTYMVFAFSICLFICFINLVDRNYILVLGCNSRGVTIGGDQPPRIQNLSTSVIGEMNILVMVGSFMVKSNLDYFSLASAIGYQEYHCWGKSLIVLPNSHLPIISSHTM